MMFGFIALQMVNLLPARVQTFSDLNLLLWLLRCAEIAPVFACKKLPESLGTSQGRSSCN